jgi:predicted nucleotidyltransferase
MTQNIDNFSGYLQLREERARRARQEAARKLAMLERLSPVFWKYGLKRAYVFGSVLKGACRQDSDIDLYVEGLDPERFWDLWKDLENQTDEAIDLYCQRDDPLFIQKIKERGRMIYEA